MSTQPMIDKPSMSKDDSTTQTRGGSSQQGSGSNKNAEQQRGGSLKPGDSPGPTANKPSNGQKTDNSPGGQQQK